LLQPAARYTKYVQGAGGWRVQRSRPELAFYCAVLEGSCRILRADAGAMTEETCIVLHAGDFFLAPALQGFTLASMDDCD
ncbi:cupin domain-containing protein, partial [Acinetobacter baumannii]